MATVGAVDLKHTVSEELAKQGVFNSHEHLLSDSQRGIIGLKSTVSSWRSLEFGSSTHSSVNDALSHSAGSLERSTIVEFEDFVFLKIVEGAGTYGLPLQIHTGTSYGPGGRASTRRGSVDHLADIVQQYPQTRFVMMHASWPYWGEIEQLAKRFPNVYLDLSWAIMMSPEESRRMLASMFTSVPVHKFIWGGDCVYVEETYGVFIQACEIVCTALYDLVERKYLSTAEAVEVAVRVFCTNGVNLYF